MRCAHTPMTLGNMRASVRKLAAFCEARDCRHAGVVDVERFGDDLPVASLGPRLRCTMCGHRGADAWPNWQERAPFTLFGR